MSLIGRIRQILLFVFWTNYFWNCLTFIKIEEITCSLKMWSIIIDLNPFYHLCKIREDTDIYLWLYVFFCKSPKHKTNQLSPVNISLKRISVHCSTYYKPIFLAGNTIYSLILRCIWKIVVEDGQRAWTLVQTNNQLSPDKISLKCISVHCSIINQSFWRATHYIPRFCGAFGKYATNNVLPNNQC